MIAVLSTVTRASCMSKTILPFKHGFIQRIQAGSVSVYRSIHEKRSPVGEQHYKSKQVAVLDASSHHQKYSGYVSFGTTQHERALPASTIDNTHLVDESDSLESILAQEKFAPKILRGSPAKTLYRKLARQFQEQLDKRTQ